MDGPERVSFLGPIQPKQSAVGATTAILRELKLALQVTKLWSNSSYVTYAMREPVLLTYSGGNGPQKAADGEAARATVGGGEVFLQWSSGFKKYPNVLLMTSSCF
jgi:hypothetical protein